jgi:hypothetical protein
MKMFNILCLIMSCVTPDKVFLNQFPVGDKNNNCAQLPLEYYQDWAFSKNQYKKGCLPSEKGTVKLSSSDILFFVNKKYHQELKFLLIEENLNQTKIKYLEELENKYKNSKKVFLPFEDHKYGIIISKYLPKGKISCLELCNGIKIKSSFYGYELSFVEEFIKNDYFFATVDTKIFKVYF